jgi:hypothetical protein
MADAGQDEAECARFGAVVCWASDSAMGTVYTIGHSAHSVEVFSKWLSTHAIQVLVDVRSAPYSRYAPQFDREILQRSLQISGV